MNASDDRGASDGGERSFAFIERGFRDLVERLPAVVYEAEPGPDGTFHYVSPQIEELLGYSPAEWLANPQLWLERLHPDDREETVRGEREHARDARGRDVRMRAEYRMVHRDGRVVLVRDEARLTQSGAGPAVWRGVLIEMTASAEAPDPPTAPGGDALRLSCLACGASWAAERREPCHRCGAHEVRAISLNATLAALAASQRNVERLVGGIHEHLDELGIWAAPGTPPRPREPEQGAGG